MLYLQRGDHALEALQLFKVLGDLGSSSAGIEQPSRGGFWSGEHRLLWESPTCFHIRAGPEVICCTCKNKDRLLRKPSQK